MHSRRKKTSPSHRRVPIKPWARAIPNPQGKGARAKPNEFRMMARPPSSRSKHAMLFACLFSVETALAAIPPDGIVFLPTAKEAELYRLVREDPDQQRVQVVLDPRLCLAARKHAADTQSRKFFSHVNPDGVNANQRAINEGYPLPANYTPSQNYIESMAGSTVDTPADAVASWRNSPAHASQVFGQVPFYREQVVLGVGHAPASGLGYATYVLLSAPLPVGEQGAPLQMPTPRLEIESPGTIFLTALPPQAILEVWKSGPALNSWTLERSTVVGASAQLTVGSVSGRAGFFRLGYYRQ